MGGKGWNDHLWYRKHVWTHSVPHPLVNRDLFVRRWRLVNKLHPPHQCTAHGTSHTSQNNSPLDTFSNVISTAWNRTKRENLHAQISSLKSPSVRLCLENEPCGKLYFKPHLNNCRVFSWRQTTRSRVANRVLRPPGCRFKLLSVSTHWIMEVDTESWRGHNIHYV